MAQREIQPITTTYAGVRFRSRLEARWAAFFDLVGWTWEYEPLDLASYIPDFILRLPHAPLLVEVKPAITMPELVTPSVKILQSGWPHEFLTVGACIFESPEWTGAPSLGLLYERHDGDGVDGGSTVGRCGAHWGLSHDLQSYHCRVCGNNDGNPLVDEAGEVVLLWRRAGNATQWRKESR